MNRRLATVARIVASLGLVALVVWWVDTAQLRATLGRLTLAGLVPVVLMHTGDRLLMAFKWQRLLAARDGGLPLGEAIRAYYVSSFAGVFLPMTVGADLVRVGALRGSAVGPGRLVASIAVERALGAVSQVLFSVLALSLVIALQLRSDVPLGWLAAALAAGTVVAIAAVPLSFRWSAALDARWRDADGPRAKLAGLAAEYAAWRDHPAAMRAFFLLTLIEGLFPIATYCVAARALGVPAGMVEMTAAVPLVYLAARMPIGFGGLGVEQGGFAGVAALLGIMGAAEATAVSLLVSPIALLIALLPGAISWTMTRRRT